VLVVGTNEGYCADNQGTCEQYNTFTQTAVERDTFDLPIPTLSHTAVTELNGTVYVIGGSYKDAATGSNVISDRVFYLDHKKQCGWVEHEAKTITARDYAAAATYQGKVWLAGGHGAGGRNEIGNLSSIEVFDPLVGSWQAAGSLTRVTDCVISLFVIKDDLFAAAGNRIILWIEKRDRQTGAWHLVSEILDGDRHCCAMASCGSKIYFFGGSRAKEGTSWNSFDTSTNTWASQEGPYRNEFSRQMPRVARDSQAVCITPNEQLLALTTWTNYPDFVDEKEHCSK